jgi:hypothetical protein
LDGKYLVKKDLTEGMVTIEEFSKSKDIAVDKIIEMVRDGFYEGRIVEGQWYRLFLLLYYCGIFSIYCNNSNIE